MTKAKINVIQYPNITVLLTGHIIDFTKTLRGKGWRIEVWDGQSLKFFCNEAAVAWADCPKEIQRYAHGAMNWFRSSTAIITNKPE